MGELGSVLTDGDGGSSGGPSTLWSQLSRQKSEARRVERFLVHSRRDVLWKPWVYGEEEVPQGVTWRGPGQPLCFALQA